MAQEQKYLLMNGVVLREVKQGSLNGNLRVVGLIAVSSVVGNRDK